MADFIYRSLSAPSPGIARVPGLTEESPPPRQRRARLFKHNSPQPCPTPLHVPRIQRSPDGSVFATRQPIRCLSWSCPACRELRLKYLYAMICKHCPVDNFHFLTLTLRATRPAIKDDWFRLTKCWDVLMKRLRRLKSDLRFFRCVELTKFGMPHIHAIINYRMSDHRIHDAWYDITGDSFIARFEAIESSVAGYILKYLDKGLASVRKIRDLTGKKTRIFQTSRGLFPIRPRVKKFDLIGYADTKYKAVNLLQFEYEDRPPRVELDGPPATYHEGGFLMSFKYQIKKDFLPGPANLSDIFEVVYEPEGDEAQSKFDFSCKPVVLDSKD